LLSNNVLGVNEAAKYLGIRPNSLEVAAFRGRIAYAKMAGRLLFTKKDLDQYREGRGKGRASKLTFHPPFVIKPR